MNEILVNLVHKNNNCHLKFSFQIIKNIKKNK